MPPAALSALEVVDSHPPSSFWVVLGVFGCLELRVLHLAACTAFKEDFPLLTHVSQKKSHAEKIAPANLGSIKTS